MFRPTTLKVVTTSSHTYKIKAIKEIIYGSNIKETKLAIPSLVDRYHIFSQPAENIQKN